MPHITRPMMLAVLLAVAALRANAQDGDGAPGLAMRAAVWIPGPA